MKIFRGIEELPDFKNAVITIGSFDGVHLGHKKILNRIKNLAQESNGESVVISFYPHPRSVVTPLDKSLVLLSTLDEKIRLLEKVGIDNLVIVPFSLEFSQMSPREYIENFLLKRFRPRHIVIGYDHRFGLNRSGDINLLKDYALDHKFIITEIDKEEIDQNAISSTKIRNFIQSADLDEANLFLGHPYLIIGKVISGDKIGNKLGFPTANIMLEDTAKLVPAAGVYAVKVKVDEDLYQGMMYIGNRPTLSADGKRSIEVNIFELDENLYGKTLEIEVLGFIREDFKFDTLEELRNQLFLDKKMVENRFEQLSKIHSDQKNISIAILNYNGEELLEGYLPSVLKSSSYPFEIVVIDNNSTDDSLEYLREWHPEIKITKLPKNLGFAAGYNEGLKNISSEYVVLLNSDVKVREDWLTPIIDMMNADHSIAIAQPKILSIEDPDEFEYAGAGGGMIDRFGYPFCRGRIFDSIEKDNGQYDDTIETAWISGAAMVLRTDIFKTLGGFDSLYFAHHEEIDFCLRARSAGYKCVYHGKSVVFHLGGGTLEYENSRKIYLNFRNSLITLLKNSSSKTAILLFLSRLILDGMASLLFIRKFHFSAIGAIIRAHFSVYKNLPMILKNRKKYRKLINENSIGPANKSGVYPGLIAFDHYIRGIKDFKKLSFLPLSYKKNEG